MNRNNTLYLIIGALVVTTIVLGYQFYQSQQKPGVEISIGAGGLSIQEK
jgi:RsiW-degrading membrane proteinase PrsW (M82 family)